MCRGVVEALVIINKGNAPWPTKQQYLGLKQNPKPQKILLPEAELRQMVQEAKKPTDQNVKKDVRKGKQGEKSGYAFRPRGKLNG